MRTAPRRGNGGLTGCILAPEPPRGTFWSSAAVALCLFATPVLADVTGPARVIDGDSLEVAGERIRLHGIDAPEGRQLCLIDGKQWQCGQHAANILADFISGRPVTCKDLGRDRYKRIIARCAVAGEDMGSWLVSEGLAFAYRRYSLDYVDQEAEAQAAQRGLWAGEFVKPWDWRRGKRLAANDNAPDQCRIKGNINRKGERIYHVPGQQAYGVTRINPATGEQWFCSEDDARAAGWRRALR